MKTIWMPFVAVAVAACGVWSCGSEDRTIRVGQRIHHDDFEYSVTGCRVAKAIGEGKKRITAAGNFYVVVFLVENNAKRVGHPWDDSIAYIVDERGNVFENLPWAQKALNFVSRTGQEGGHVTPAGSSDSTVLVFDLPDEVRAPSLMVRGETLMGDFFDGGQFRKVKVSLW